MSDLKDELIRDIQQYADPASAEETPVYRLPDYSAWLTDERLRNEAVLWEQCGYYRMYAQLVTEHLNQGKTIVEFGCGVGLVPIMLPKDVRYIGIDANAGCVAAARVRNESRVGLVSFAVGDVRTVDVAEVDLTCAFAFLKHFALDEWPEIVCRVLAPGRRSVFTIPLAGSDVEDGTAYPHTRVTRETMTKAVEAAGHQVVGLRYMPFEEYAVFTARQ